MPEQLKPVGKLHFCHVHLAQKEVGGHEHVIHRNEKVPGDKPDLEELGEVGLSEEEEEEQCPVLVPCCHVEAPDVRESLQAGGLLYGPAVALP